MKKKQKTFLQKKKWYVIQVFSGYEDRIKTQIIEQIKTKKLNSFFKRIIIPTEEIVEIKNGQKCKTKRKLFPGYLLILMNMNEKIWQLIRHIPKVNGFIGGTSNNPLPITNEEAGKILQSINKNNNKNPKPRTTFQTGEVIRVLKGPFADFTGIVEEIYYDKSCLQVAVFIFGRSTPVELEFSQVEKES